MKYQYIEAPLHKKQKYSNSLFLGGGITNCANWQEKIASQLTDLEVTVYNPRRENFDTADAKNSEIQISWEYLYIRKCSHLLFYFSHETLCPITLLEYGSALERSQKLYIFCEPDYKRKFDVIFQGKCAIKKNKRKDLYLFTDYDKFVKKIRSDLR